MSIDIPGLRLQKEQIHQGNLILVNQQYACPDRGEGRLVPAWEEMASVLLCYRAAALLSKLMEEIRGWRKIVPVSGWRSQQEQQEIWDSSLQEHGRDFTERYVAVPGHSEHQTGLAIDLGIKKEEIDFIRPDFPHDGICQSFRLRAAQYGFVERYPAGKETVTGIAYEPWHFRYVGMPHASIMEREGLVLEEYVAFLRQFPYGEKPYRFQPDSQGSQEIQVSFLLAERAEELQGRDRKGGLPEPSVPYSVSGNNIDGFILTEYRRQKGEYHAG